MSCTVGSPTAAHAAVPEDATPKQSDFLARQTVAQYPSLLAAAPPHTEPSAEQATKRGSFSWRIKSGFRRQSSKYSHRRRRSSRASSMVSIEGAPNNDATAVAPSTSAPEPATATNTAIANHYKDNLGKPSSSASPEEIDVLVADPDGQRKACKSRTSTSSTAGDILRSNVLTEAPSSCPTGTPATQPSAATATPADLSKSPVWSLLLSLKDSVQGSQKRLSESSASTGASSSSSPAASEKDTTTISDVSTKFVRSDPDLPLSAANLVTAKRPIDLTEIALRMTIKGCRNAKQESALGIQKVEIRKGGDKTKFALQSETGKVEVRSYYNAAFDRLREIGSVTKELETAFESPLSFTGAGKSGSIMYWTPGKRFVAKSMTPSEVKQFKKFMETYPGYIESHPCSLLSRFLGFYKIRPQEFGAQPTYFVVMQNVFGKNATTLTDLFDLKGSTFGRFTLPSKIPGKPAANSNPAPAAGGKSMLKRPKSIMIKKDLNFRKENRCFHFEDEEAHDTFMTILKEDTEYLQHHGVLDYSLLVGIHTGGNWDAGIIDILTPYTFKKQAEHVFMGGLLGRKKTISCIPPHKYAGRFLEFVKSHAQVKQQLTP